MYLTINVLLVVLAVPRVGLLYVIVVFPDHTHLLFHCIVPLSKTHFNRCLALVQHRRTGNDQSMTEIVD